MESIEHPLFIAIWMATAKRRSIPYPRHRTVDPRGLMWFENERLMTSNGKGLVTSRTVLLKALDEDGFVFFTNTQSLKGRQLRECPRASATFLWKASGCQVQLVGTVEQVSNEAADAYFSTRDQGQPDRRVGF